MHRQDLQVDETALDSARAGVIPDNTAKNNRWALNNFAEWTKSRASSCEPVPEGILSSCDAELVTKWLSLRFGNMPRVRQAVPPKSIYMLLCGLYRNCKSNGVPFNFLDKGDSRFRVLYDTLNTVFST